jgi:hypothetical protein
MKKLMMLAAMLALVLVAAVPVLAQSLAFDDQELESGEIGRASCRERVYVIV